MRTDRTYWLPLFCLVSLILHLVLYGSRLGMGSGAGPDIRPPEVEVSLVPDRTPPPPKPPQKRMVKPVEKRKPVLAAKPRLTPKPVPPPTVARTRGNAPKPVRIARAEPVVPASAPAEATPTARDLLPVRESAHPPVAPVRPAGATDELTPPNRTSVPPLVLPKDPRRMVEALNDSPQLPRRASTPDGGPIRVARATPAGGSFGSDTSPAPSGQNPSRRAGSTPAAPPDYLVDSKTPSLRGDLSLPGEHVTRMPGNRALSATKLLNPIAGLDEGPGGGLGPGGKGLPGNGAGVGGGQAMRIKRSGAVGSSMVGTGSGVGPGSGSISAGRGRGHGAGLPDLADGNGYGPGGAGSGTGDGRGAGGGIGDGIGPGTGEGAGVASGGRGVAAVVSSRGALFGDVTRLLGGQGGAGNAAGGSSRGSFLRVRPALLPGGRLRVVYALDISGSMREGDKIGKAQAALRRALSELRPYDAFDIITFKRDIYRLSDRLLPATPENIQKGVDYINNIQIGDGTFLSGALDAALNVDGATQIFVASDGEPNGGIGDFNQLRQFVLDKNKQKVRIMTLAIGRGEQFKGMALLKGIADDNNGTFNYINTELIPSGR